MKPHPFVSGNLIVNRIWRADPAASRRTGQRVRLVIKEIEGAGFGYSVVLTVGDNGKLQKDWLFDNDWKVVG